MSRTARQDRRDVVGRAEEDLRATLGDLLRRHLIGVPRGVLGLLEAVPVAVDAAGEHVRLGHRGPRRVGAVGVQEPPDVERERRLLARLAVTLERFPVETDGRLDAGEQVAVGALTLFVRLGVGTGVHDEAVGERRGPVDGVGVVATDHDRRPPRLVRERGDDQSVARVVAALVLDRTTAPRLPADVDQLDRAPDALGRASRRTPRTRCRGSRVRDRRRSARRTACRERPRLRRSGSDRAAARARDRSRS